MMTRRFRFVAVYLGAFSLGAATAVAHTPTRTAGVARIAVSTVETGSAAQAMRADTSHSDVPMSLTAGQMRETVGAGWWDGLVEVVTSVGQSVIDAGASAIGVVACGLNPSSCG
jgi:hypothetical protein